jgi:hypothetical protein
MSDLYRKERQQQGFQVRPYTPYVSKKRKRDGGVMGNNWSQPKKAAVHQRVSYDRDMIGHRGEYDIRDVRQYDNLYKKPKIPVAPPRPSGPSLEDLLVRGRAKIEAKKEAKKEPKRTVSVLPEKVKREPPKEKYPYETHDFDNEDFDYEDLDEEEMGFNSNARKPFTGRPDPMAPPIDPDYVTDSEEEQWYEPEESGEDRRDDLAIDFDDDVLSEQQLQKMTIPQIKTALMNKNVKLPSSQVNFSKQSWIDLYKRCVLGLRNSSGNIDK